MYSEDQKAFFIDVAGYMDADGPFFDLLNSFIIKFLFENAKTVKFLCPLTNNEIEQVRGKSVFDLFNQLKLMCPNHLMSFVDSIIPVITKCKP